MKKLSLVAGLGLLVTTLNGAELNDQESRFKDLLLSLESVGSCSFKGVDFQENIGMFGEESGVALRVNSEGDSLRFLLPVPAIGGEASTLEVEGTEEQGTFSYASDMIVKWTTVWRTYKYEVEGEYEGDQITSIKLTKNVYAPRSAAAGIPGYWYDKLVKSQTIVCN